MRIALFTSGRQDWGILAPVARAIVVTEGLELVLVAGGLHLRDQDATVFADLTVAERIDALPPGDDGVAVAQAAGATTALLAAALGRQHADALLVAGDRSETLAAALAATCLRLPIVHLHGGEETTGAIDNACRHALTKLAHLHCVAHARYGARVVAMGEDPARVLICGAPALDAALLAPCLDDAALARSLGRERLGWPLLLFTHHPTTLAFRAPADEVEVVLAGVERALAAHPDALVIMSTANHDSGGGAINARLAARVAADPRRFLLQTALGVERYYALMARADVMVGNSSSGILEAPSFALPVVNIGERQDGRLRLGRISDVAVDAAAISAAISAALPAARSSAPPRPFSAAGFGDGRAAARIAAGLTAFAHLSPAQRLAKSVPESQSNAQRVTP